MALDWTARGWADERPEAPMAGVCAEFRAALWAEIGAAERAVPTSASPLEAGRRIGRLAGAFQYVFSAASPLSVTSDSPAELVVDGLPPLQAVVVSVEGLDVTVSVARDLGDRVARAALRGDLVLPLRRLVAQIEQAGSDPNPAGDRLLGVVPAAGAAEAIDEAASDDAQEAALGSSLRRDITFICAPPGAGKTRVIGSIGANLYRRGRSLLLVSQTSRAVDQALAEIAQRLGGELASGTMLRIGIPSDNRLRRREDLLFDAVVSERQGELRARRGQVEAERAATRRRIAENERLIRVAAWATEGRAELADFLLRLEALHSREASARRLADEVARRTRDEPELRARLTEAQHAERAAAEARRLRAELPPLVAELEAARELAAVAGAAVARARSDLEKAVELEPLLARECALPPLAEQRRAVEALISGAADAKQAARAAREALSDAEEAHITESSGPAIQRLRGFAIQIRARQVVARRRAQLAAAEARLERISGRLGRAADVLAELEELDRQLAPWRKLDAGARQEARLEMRKAEHRSAVATQTELERRYGTLQRQLAQATEAVEHFRRSRAAEPRSLIARVEPQLAELRQLRERLCETERRADELRTALDAELSLRLAVTEALALGRGSPPESADERFTQLALAHSEARRLASEIDEAELRAAVTACRRELSAIDEAVAHVDEELEAIRQTVIADARVVGATLTRVYVSNEPQDRRFDTVILDEASLAPIPALWIAARLADANLVVVGDLGQRPPGTQSDHPLAHKWLGRHIFDAAKDRSDRDRGNPPQFIELQELPDVTTSP